MCDWKHPFDCIVGVGEMVVEQIQPPPHPPHLPPCQVRQPDCWGRSGGRKGAGPTEAASFPSGWLMSGCRNVDKQRNTHWGSLFCPCEPQSTKPHTARGRGSRVGGLRGGGAVGPLEEARSSGRGGRGGAEWTRSSSQSFKSEFHSQTQFVLYKIKKNGWFGFGWID